MVFNTPSGQPSRAGGLLETAMTQYVTDGGLETDLLFNHGAELPEFAAFPLVDDPSGAALLEA